MLCKIAKNRSTKGTPLQALACAIKKLELALAIADVHPSCNVPLRRAGPRSHN